MKIASSIFLLAAVSAGSASADGLALKSASAINRSTAVSAAPISATATTSSASNAVASTTSQGGAAEGGAAQGVGSQGQSLSIDSHAVYEAQARNPVATAVAPALTSSNDTCMGSTSMGASAANFGISFGSSWTDKNCLMLKNAREIWNMGFKGAALARLCMDDLNREALESTGINCPQRKNSGAAAGHDATDGIKPRSVSNVDNDIRG